MVRLADDGAAKALVADPGFLGGLSVHAGRLADATVTADQGREFTAPTEAFATVAA